MQNSHFVLCSIVKHCTNKSPTLEFSQLQRHRVVGKVEGGLSFCEVARRMGCSHQTIMKLVERNDTIGSVSDRQRPGGQKVTSQQQDWNIVLSHLRNRFRTAVKTAQETRN